jgi:hypothetical protein
VFFADLNEIKKKMFDLDNQIDNYSANLQFLEAQKRSKSDLLDSNAI